MSILSFFGCGKKAPEYPADTLTTRDGTQITITFFRHASLSVEAGGKYIYVDPVSGYADYAALPKADVVLITHSHYDHLDVAAVEAIQTPQTEILCDRTSAEAFEMNCYTMRPGSVATPRDYLKVEAVAAYNTTDGHLPVSYTHLHRGRNHPAAGLLPAVRPAHTIRSTVMSGFSRSRST